MDDMANHGSSVDQPIQIGLVQNSELNREALTLLFGIRPDFATVWSFSSLDDAIAASGRQPVDVVVLDAAHQGRTALPTALQLVGNGRTRAAMLLDDAVHLERSADVAQHRAVGYITRNAGFDALCRGIWMLATGRPAMDIPTTNGSATSHIYDGPHRALHVPGLARLTPRETEVMRLIALGNTVKDCARILQLAQSTVDNHKTRLMKKLNVHKSSDLTRLAIREGLITA